MTTSQAKTFKPGMAMACLLLGAIAPNLHAQGVQYAQPHNNAMQAQPHRTAPHYYTAHSNLLPNVSAMQTRCPPDQELYQGRCVPDRRQQDPRAQRAPAHPHHYTAHSVMPPNIGAMQPGCPPNTARNSQGRCVTIPRDPYHKPFANEQQSSASNTHGIIFVGGKQALNPQPIPPGHAIKRLPQPGAPVQQPISH